MQNQKRKFSCKPKTAPKRTPVSKEQTSIKVGNMSDISGNVNIAGENITTYQETTRMSTEEINLLFERLYAAIEDNARTTPANKEDLKAEFEEIQSKVTEAIQENKKVKESFLLHRFRNIARVAPDVLDVAVATLASPLAGLGLAFKKIAERAKDEIKQG